MNLVTKDEIRNIELPIVIKKNTDDFSTNNNMYRHIIIKSGSGIMRLNGKSILFTSPSMFCLNHYDELSLEKEVSVEADVIYFLPSTLNNAFSIEAIETSLSDLYIDNHFDVHLLKAFLYRDETLPGYHPLNLRSFKKMEKLYDDMALSLSNLVDFWRCRSRGLLIEILLITQHLLDNENPSDQDTVIGTSEIIKDIVLHLHTFYSNKITVNELALEYGTNRTTLAQKFREETGFTINKYLTKIRMNISEALLRDTLIPISEIAYRCGFNDITHFTRTYKKHNEFSPSDYRKQIYG